MQIKIKGDTHYKHTKHLCGWWEPFFPTIHREHLEEKYQYFQRVNDRALWEGENQKYFSIHSNYFFLPTFLPLLPPYRQFFLPLPREKFTQGSHLYFIRKYYLWN